MSNVLQEKKAIIEKYHDQENINFNINKNIENKLNQVAHSEQNLKDEAKKNIAIFNEIENK
jgi:hypothetical protein